MPSTAGSAAAQARSATAAALRSPAHHSPPQRTDVKGKRRRGAVEDRKVGSDAVCILTFIHCHLCRRLQENGKRQVYVCTVYMYMCVHVGVLSGWAVCVCMCACVCVCIIQ